MEERQLRTLLEEAIIKPKKKKLKTQHGLGLKELWRLRKQLQRLILIPGNRKRKKKLQRHHKDGDITNNSKDNVLVLTEPEHIKIHQKAGTYHKNSKGGD